MHVVFVSKQNAFLINLKSCVSRHKEKSISILLFSIITYNHHISVQVELKLKQSEKIRTNLKFIISKNIRKCTLLVVGKNQFLKRFIFIAHEFKQTYRYITKMHIVLFNCDNFIKQTSNIYFHRNFELKVLVIHLVQ